MKILFKFTLLFIFAICIFVLTAVSLALQNVSPLAYWTSIIGMLGFGALMSLDELIESR